MELLRKKSLTIFSKKSATIDILQGHNYDSVDMLNTFKT